MKNPPNSATMTVTFFSIEIKDGKLNFAQWTYHTIQNRGAEVVQFGQCLHYSGDCGIHPDNRFAVQECESCQ